MANEVLPPYQNNSRSAISSYLDSVQPPIAEKRYNSRHRPSIEMVEMAEKVFKKMPFGETQGAVMQITQELTNFKGEDALLSRNCLTSDLLSAMFLQERGRLPKTWQTNDDIIRTVVSMAANNDIAYFKNKILHTEFDSDLSTPAVRANDENIPRLEKLIDSLQARASVSQTGGIV